MKALVLGGNGQDGTYLTRALLAGGHEVVAVGRQPVARFDYAGPYRYRQLDLRNAEDLRTLLRAEAPELVFHFAAVHKSAAGAPYEDRFGEMLAVNVESVHVILEHARVAPLRLIYASSAKAFGDPLPASIDEQTPRRSSCLYAVTKNAATDLIHYYRQVHQVAGSVVYLFQHESPLRPAEFFVPKLAGCLARAIASQGSARTDFHTLDFFCDWGSAEEYAELIVETILRAPGEDFVLATGRCVHAREVAERVFAAHDLRLTDHISETEPQRGGTAYRVRLDKLARLIGRVPQRTVERIIEEMVKSYIG
jgi:GDPmannose 4,6-dehydratase